MPVAGAPLPQLKLTAGSTRFMKSVVRSMLSKYSPNKPSPADWIESLSSMVIVAVRGTSKTAAPLTLSIVKLNCSSDSGRESSRIGIDTNLVVSPSAKATVPDTPR